MYANKKKKHKNHGEIVPEKRKNKFDITTTKKNELYPLSIGNCNEFNVAQTKRNKKKKDP